MLPTYSILNVEQVLDDVTHRSRIVHDFKVIVERKIKLEKEYRNGLLDITHIPQFRKIKDATKSSELIFNSLINTFVAETENCQQYVLQLGVEVEKMLEQILAEQESETKKHTTTIRNLLRDFQISEVQVSKSKKKLDKKMNELRKLKEECLVSFLSGMPFEKQNDLYIKVDKIQEKCLPLQKDYQNTLKYFQVFAKVYADKLDLKVKRVCELEKQKIEAMKDIFMSLQISRSQFSANLVQDNNSILTRISLIAQNPEFENKCKESDKEKVMIKNKEHHPYLKTLFHNMFHCENSKSLIKYGQGEIHRKSLHNSLLNNLQRVEQGMELSAESRKVEEVGSHFRAIFDDDRDETEKQVKTEMLKTIMNRDPQGRKNFILCLQKYRRVGKFEISLEKIPAIRKIFNIFLDQVHLRVIQCMEEKDTYNSKLLMVLSFTYYAMQGERKMDLHELIKDHEIWSDKDWWECALLESVYEQLKVKSKKPEEQAPIDIWEIKGAGIKQAENSNQLTFQNIIFNQLTYYVHNMRLFEIKEEIISKFAFKYAQYFFLNSSIMDDLKLYLEESEANCNSSDDSSGVGSPSRVSHQKTM